MIVRPVVLISVYNNQNTIAGVVSRVASTTSLPIIVVDDGSDVAVEDVVSKAKVLSSEESARVCYIRLSSNQGKGAALQRGFAKAIEAGYSHAVAVDGDGQHPAQAVLAVYGAIQRDPRRLIIGARRWPAAHVPRSSRFGRQFSNFWVWYQTGKWVSDSQSGLRVYPLFLIQNLTFFTKRYEFEIECLVKLLWRGYLVREVEIDVVYQEGDRRVSHFRPCLDNLRISLLNTWFVIRKLFGGNWQPLIATESLVVAIVLTLAVPHHGSAFALVVLLTVFLRLNAVACLLGFLLSLVSDGSFLTVFCAVWVAVALGFGGRNFLRRRSKTRSKPTTWSGKMRGGKIGNGFLKFLCQHVGLGAARFCLFFIVPYFFLFAPTGRRASLQYFKALKPEASTASRFLDTLKHFYTFGVVLLDRLYQSFHKEDVFCVTVEAPDAVRNLLAQNSRKKGVILVTAHVGGWDLSTRALMHVSGVRQLVVAEFVHESGFDSDAVVRAGEEELHQKISRGTAYLPIFAYREILEKGHTLAMMGDRPLSEKFAWLPFLGKLAAFDLTPYRLAMTLKVPVVFCLAAKTGNKTYHFALHPCDPPTEVISKDDSSIQMAAAFALNLEKFIYLHPHQWFNFFSFFEGVSPPVVTR